MQQLHLQEDSRKPAEKWNCCHINSQDNKKKETTLAKQHAKMQVIRT
jgi:hypothetical protein